MKNLIVDIIKHDLKRELQAVKACDSLHAKNEAIEALHLATVEELALIGYTTKNSVIIDAIYALI